MTNKPSTQYWRIATIFLSLALIGLLVYLSIHSTIATVFAENPNRPTSAAAQVTQAWDNVRKSNHYAFSANVAIKTIPLPTAGNIGRFSKTNSLYIEGSNNLRDKSVQMALWNGNTNAGQQNTAYQLRIQDDVVQTRVGNGEWQNSNDGALALAPNGDFLAFLDVAQNIALANDKRPANNDAACTTINCNQLAVFNYDLDGRAYAEKLTHLSQEQLARSGQLPPGAALQTPQHLRNITGSGELWIDGRNLPVRQRVTLNIPAASGSDNRSETVMDIYFTDYQMDPLVLAAAPWAQPAVSAITHAALPSASTLASEFALLVLMALSLLILTRPSRRMRVGINLTVLIAIVFGPSLQAHASTVAWDNLRDKQAKQVATENAQEAQQQVNVAQADAAPYTPPAPSDQSAPANALAPAASILDSDGDGLTDDFENLIGSSPFNTDTDFDTIDDGVEVTGFSYNNKTWYGNPLLADSNADGIIDSLEWNLTAPDRDSDGTPDLYDLDEWPFRGGFRFICVAA